jgi:hypothetical protein
MLLGVANRAVDARQAAVNWGLRIVNNENDSTKKRKMSSHRYHRMQRINCYNLCSLARFAGPDYPVSRVFA